ncbi:MAG: ABC-F family ATP-binding cassette domain-containing protein [Planctomycetota bacterium]|nr:MAG: ABC-F family ATP-binding cassette domain-containing protein [Planctomycetota bacterium]
MVVTITDLDFRYGSQILFEEADLKVEDGWKVGLIGPNGSGKSSLFRLITGREHAEFGAINLPNSATTGYFDQDVGEMAGCSAIEMAIRRAGRVHELRGRIGQLEHDLADPDQLDRMDALLAELGELQSEFQHLGGYDVEARAKEVLAGLGFSAARMQQDVGQLSGGWKMRVALAGILLMQPELLLLDEPTNHLDLESILWLEEFIRGYHGTVIMTCHDHEFMNRVVDRIVEIDEGKLRVFPGDYDFYLAQREMEDTQRHASYERQQAWIEKELKSINRFRAKAAHASRAQSRLKKLDKLEKLEPPRSRREKVVFRIPAPPRSGNDVYVAEGLGKSFGEHVVYVDLDLHVRIGERWAVMGVNGAGKTTLLKIIIGDLQPDGGKSKQGASLRVGYFAQHTTELLDLNQTVIGAMTAEFPGESVGALRRCLAGFGFDERDLEKSVAWLSGGEKARLVLARMLYDPPNFLVLDEPTNHLDVEAKQALVDSLRNYEGTMIFVSHDRHFLEALATHTLEIDGGSATVYYGGYKEYVRLTGHEAPGAPARAAVA